MHQCVTSQPGVPFSKQGSSLRSLPLCLENLEWAIGNWAACLWTRSLAAGFVAFCEQHKTQKPWIKCLCRENDWNGKLLTDGDWKLSTFPLQIFHPFHMKLCSVCVCVWWRGGFVGGKVGVSPFKGVENKTGNHPLVLARGGYKCLEFRVEFTCYAQVRACTHAQTQTRTFTHLSSQTAEGMCGMPRWAETWSLPWMLWGAMVE